MSDKIDSHRIVLYANRKEADAGFELEIWYMQGNRTAYGEDHVIIHHIPGRDAPPSRPHTPETYQVRLYPKSLADVLPYTNIEARVLEPGEVMRYASDEGRKKFFDVAEACGLEK